MGLGFSLGPLLSGYIAEKISYNASYILSVFFALLALLLIVFGIENNDISKDQSEKSEKN